MSNKQPNTSKPEVAVTANDGHVYLWHRDRVKPVAKLSHKASNRLANAMLHAESDARQQLRAAGINPDDVTE